MLFGTAAVARKEHGSSLRVSDGTCPDQRALFLNAAKTTHTASLRSEVPDLLRSIGRRIKVRVSDYGVFILALPSKIAFASVWGSLGSPSAVTTFGRAMERHGIIIVAASASATAGHRDGGESTWG